MLFSVVLISFILVVPVSLCFESSRFYDGARKQNFRNKRHDDVISSLLKQYNAQLLTYNHEQALAAWDISINITDEALGKFNAFLIISEFSQYNNRHFVTL